MIRSRRRRLQKDVKIWYRSWKGELLKFARGVRSRPGFLIIGAQKAGTSSLFNYLALHPRLQAAYKKEVGYFSTAHYQQGARWYQRQFPPLGSGEYAFEATPEYLFLPWVAERIRSFDPSMKFIVLLRDPFLRAYSGWNKYRQNHRDPVIRGMIRKRAERWSDPHHPDQMAKAFAREEYPGFRETVLTEINAIREGRMLTFPSNVQRGLYSTQLHRYFKCFPREQFLILEDRELRSKKQRTLEMIWEFIGVERMEIQESDLTEYNVRHYELEIDPDTEKTLKEFLQPYNLELYDMLGREFDWSGP